jgi:hypothetical protein
MKMGKKMVKKMNKLKLSDVQWREFLFLDSNIFQIKNLTPIHKISLEKTQIKKKGIPYLSRTRENNGLDEVVNNENFKCHNGNCITFGAESTRFFYQPYDFICGNKMYSLTTTKINKYIAHFLITLLNKSFNGGNFGYGLGLTGTRLLNKKIYLPEKNNLPDWSFMERYMKQVEYELLEKEINYFETKLKKLELVKQFNELEWGEFSIINIFDIIQRGKRLIKVDQKVGNTPYISSTALKNGVDNFISNLKGVRKFDNALTIANSGSVGKVFFHPYKFIASDHVTTLKNTDLNKYHYIFLSLMIGRLAEKYSFNREINNKRIQSEKILLPITKNNMPDWEYMESYIKNIENKSIKKWLEYKNKKQD